MKKIYLIVAMIAFVGVSIVSCKNEKKEHGPEHAALTYACPMECEGDKTYADKNTKCPVCKMALVEKKSEGSHEHDAKGKEHDNDREGHGKESHEHDNDSKEHK